MVNKILTTAKVPLVYLLISIVLWGCGENTSSTMGAEGHSSATLALSSSARDTSGICLRSCDSSPPSIPVLTSEGGQGDVTTYGSVSAPEFSSGGACNYGRTGILYYAAIQGNVQPGDKMGQWQAGKSCGRCARVRAATLEGWKTAVVRITDHCPDAYCGIDLGGAAARDLMGNLPGRYYGEWEWVSCEGVEGVFDGPAAIHVKDGSNAWWSVIQARNGPGGVVRMQMRPLSTIDWQELNWATEAENFFKVPETVLQDIAMWEVLVHWSTGGTAIAQVIGNALAQEGAVILLE